MFFAIAINHLTTSSVLKEAGIVSFEKHGNKSCFSLNHDVLAEIQAAMNALFNYKPSEAKID